MLKTRLARSVALIALTIGCAGFSYQQQAPKVLSIIRNDTDSKVSFECRSEGVWQKVTLNPKQDTSVTGDRVRIGTDRQDKATVTVELPIEGGKKYLLFWNDPPGMWDFKGTS